MSVFYGFGQDISVSIGLWMGFTLSTMVAALGVQQTAKIWVADAMLTVLCKIYI